METDTRTLTVERSTSTAHRLLHYDGVCGNLHGHNFGWDVRVHLTGMTEVGEDNMPLDLKDISDQIDEVDHATLLNEDDPLMENPAALGDVLTFDSDPTCELVAEWMAKQIYGLSGHIQSVRIQCSETDKYTVEAAYGYTDDPENDLYQPDGQ